MKKQIMLVDDDPSIRYAVKAGIESESDIYEVILADSGQTCLNLLRDVSPDAIILDLMLPGLSGWEIYDLIKKNEACEHIPILFLTARTDDFAKKSCQFLGDDYIEKPFMLSDLINRITQAIERAEKNQ